MNFEQAIIYVLLKHPELILKHDVTPSDFQDILLSECLQVMRSLSLQNIEIDIMVVSEKMTLNGSLTVLSDIARNGIGVKSNLNLYIKQLKDFKLKNDLRVILSDSINEIDNSSIDEVIGFLSSKLSSLKNKDVDYAYTSKEMMVKTIDHIDEMFSLKSENKLAGVTTGITKLDKEIGGFHRSDLIIVGGRPAMGKTAFAISCAISAAKNNYKAGFISTEMSIVQVGMRVTSLTSGIKASVMRDSAFKEADWAKLTAGSKLAAELPFYVYDKPVCKVSDIAIQARAWKEYNGLDILFVDYLTRLKPENSSENKSIAIGNIATDLKTLARTLDIPIVVLAQVSRDVEKRVNKRPNMGDLRDSGVIEQEADQVLMLYRDCVYNEISNPLDSEVNIEKNRHGAVCGLNTIFDSSTMKWADPEDYEYH